MDKMPLPTKYNLCSQINEGDEDGDEGGNKGDDEGGDEGGDAGGGDEGDDEDIHTRFNSNNTCDLLKLCQSWQTILQGFFFGPPPQVSGILYCVYDYWI